MLMILLNFGVHTRNWPRIDQNSILSFSFGDFREPHFAEYLQRVKVVGLYIKLKTCSRSQKSFKIIILTATIFISLKKPTKSALRAK